MFALMLCCIRSLISTQTFQRALTVGNGQVCRDKECPFSGITSSGRVSRKVPESDVWSMMVPLLTRTAVSVCVFQDEKVKQDVEAQEAELEEQRKQEVLEQQRRRLEEERQKAEAKIQKKLQMRQQEVELREKILKNVKVGDVYVCASV